METNQEYYNDPGTKARPAKKLLVLAAILAVLFGVAYYFLLSAPKGFPEGAIFNVGEGATLRSVSLNLKNQNIIRSRTAFEGLVILYGKEKRIITADYLFEEKISVIEVARRIVRGERHLAPVKVTIPEGYNKAEIAETFSLALPYFDEAKFISMAEEGYLFPDTYFFFTTSTAEDALKSLKDNYNKKISSLRQDIAASGKSEADIIKMASVIEGEAKGDADRDTISGILWRRMDIGMRLQADAAPETYEHGGLPYKPVSNPGLSSIRAAIYPKSSPYLYYLHDKAGTIHYAKTFSEHRQNINKYLR